MGAATRYLAEADPAMAGLIRHVGRCRLQVTKGREPFESLLRAIAHQQLHARAAAAILGRFEALYPGEAFPTPAQVLATDVPTLRACGWSGGKIAAIQDLCVKAVEGVVPTRRAAARMSDAVLIERLTAVRGIGRWTVEMLLMHSLGRPDILPVDDFGVREGFRLLHGLEMQPKPKTLALAGEIWSPYRSTAAWYLWRAAEAGKTITYTAG